MPAHGGIHGAVIRQRYGSERQPVEHCLGLRRTQRLGRRVCDEFGASEPDRSSQWSPMASTGLERMPAHTLDGPLVRGGPWRLGGFDGSHPRQELFSSHQNEALTVLRSSGVHGWRWSDGVRGRDRRRFLPSRVVTHGQGGKDGQDGPERPARLPAHLHRASQPAKAGGIRSDPNPPVARDDAGTAAFWQVPGHESEPREEPPRRFLVVQPSVLYYCTVPIYCTIPSERASVSQHDKSTRMQQHR